MATITAARDTGQRMRDHGGVTRVQDAAELRTLRQAWATFLRYRSPQLLALQLALALALRLGLLVRGGLESLSPWDLAMWPLMLLLIWPLQEWVLHKHVLHLRPRELFGRRIDPEFAQAHRAHHRAPGHIQTILLPSRLLGLAVPVHVGLWLWLMPSVDLACSGIAAYGAAALHYEWIHYLTHTSVTPRSRWFRKVRRNHRYHHYKNERFWHAFTVPLVDDLFGTAPDPTSVETSKTARTLGVEE